jgi:crotonobetainyl-CoA:carnitine CoA-transferase CaiB-like acyl-CoA transferase
MKPLDGITVLDLSRVLSGPYCTMQLADMGARVIKVEGKEGDETRGFGPPFLHGESTYFMSINHGKESICLDLKHPKGKEIALQLAKKADVVVENFRPGVAARLGLGYEALRELNPRLVYASISGFGQTGLPQFSQLPGYDLVIQGLGGLQSITGDPNGPPTKVGTSIADLVTGLYCAQGVLLALFARERTGKGQLVDISMLDGQLSLLTYHAGIFFATQKSPQRRGNQHPSIVPYETYEAKDGFLNVAIANDAQYHKFVEVAGNAEIRDEKYKTNAGRVSDRDELKKLLTPIFQSKTIAEWVALLSKVGIPAGGIQSVGEALEHPQSKAREMVVERPHPTIGSVKLTGVPVKLSETPGEVGSAPPLLGQHTDSLLKELCGASDEDIAQWKKDGAVS